MNAPKSLTTAIVAAALVSAIGLAYAQSTQPQTAAEAQALVDAQVRSDAQMRVDMQMRADAQARADARAAAAQQQMQRPIIDNPRVYNNPADYGSSSPVLTERSPRSDRN